MEWLKSLILVPLLIGVDSSAYAPEKKKDQIKVPARASFKPFQYLIGPWKGEGTGQPGNSSATVKYEYILDSTYIKFEGKSAYKPQEKNPQGEVHRGMGLIGYDKLKQRYFAYIFHNESFVEQDSITFNSDSSEFSLHSQNLTNIPLGWNSRSTFKRIDSKSYQQIFELAAPGKEFVTYVTNKMNKVK